MIRIHRETHAAAGFAPLETGLIENFIEAFVDGLAGDFLRARHGEGAHAVGDFFAFDELGRLTQVGQAAVGAGTDEDDIDGCAGDGLAFLETHVFVGLAYDELIGLGKGIDRGQLLRHANGLRGRDAPRNERLDIFAANLDDVVVLGIGIAGERLPVGHSAIPRLALGAVVAALKIIEGGLVGVHITATRAALDGHVAHGHALFHCHAVDNLAAEFVRKAHTAIHAEAVDVSERDVLRVNAGLELTGEINAAHLELGHRERLRGQHIGHLAGADAKGERAKGAVRGGVRIAAGNGHARLREPALGADDVHHALLAFFRREKIDAMIGGVLLNVLEHLLGQRILQRPLASGTGGGDDVVHRGKGALWERHGEVLFADHRKRLRRGDLVDQMQPDKELILPRGQLSHAMPVENLMV